VKLYIHVFPRGREHINKRRRSVIISSCIYTHWNDTHKVDTHKGM
jgi:hypothetical protein